MDIRAYRIWLSHALSYGSTKVRRILKHFGTIENFYEQGYKTWAAMGIFTEKELQAMKEFSVEHQHAVIHSIAHFRHNFGIGQ